MFARSRKAFTVVELLVVIAIIGVLVALTVPAIQMAREAARRTTCSNNAAQLAKAMQLHATARDQLPNSRAVYQINRSNAATSAVLSWVYPILPEIEQQSIYDGIRDFGIPTDRLEVEVTMCPSQTTFYSDRPMSYIVNGGRANYTDSNRRNYDLFANGALVDWALGDTSTANPNGNTGKKTRRWDDCTDGGSNTLLISENTVLNDWLVPYGASLPTPLSDKEQFTQFLWFDLSENPILPNRHLNPALRSFDATPADIEVEIRYARPASFHPGGFIVAFWDGGTRFIGDSIEYEVYGKLCSSEGAKTQAPSDTGTPPLRPNPPWQNTPLSADDY